MKTSAKLKLSGVLLGVALSSGSLMAAEGSCGAGKCGGETVTKTEKMSGSCGSGKCGGDMSKKKMMKKDISHKKMKKMSGSCGAGKCGGDMKKQ